MRSIVPFPIPHGESGLFIQNENKSGLYGGGVDAMTTEGIERIVVNIVGKRRGIHITALPEIWICLTHLFNKGLEESETGAVLSHHSEVSRIATERCCWNIPENIGSEGLFSEVITTYSTSIAKNTMQNVTQYAFPFDFIRECNFQHLSYTALDKEAKQKMRIAKNFMKSFEVNAVGLEEMELKEAVTINGGDLIEINSTLNGNQCGLISFQQ